MRRRRNIHWIICLLLHGFSTELSGQIESIDTTDQFQFSDDTSRLKGVEKIASQSKDYGSLKKLKSVWEGTAFTTLNLEGHSLQYIDLSQKAFHTSEKSGRQLFSEIPGAMIYDMDGSGNQVNLAIRGLDPHRSWEFNIRQNGIVTNSDMYGYPASHYSMPLEAVQSIEIIKGTAALQYGAQFGGMINYTLKAPSAKKIHYEGQHNLGSYGLLSTYHSLSGTLGKVNYFSYIQYRQSTGYRQNGESQASAFHFRISNSSTSKFKITAELSNSQYVYHIPGPLSLEQFLSDPRQSTRSRNYFQPNIYLPALTWVYSPNDKTTLTLITSAVLGHRNSVLFEGFANKLDTINSLTQTYANRTVDIDVFRSYTSELRLKKLFHIANVLNSLTGGIRAFNNVMWRRQLGEGTKGSDFDLSVEPNSFKRDLKFHSQSIALSVEDAIHINPRWSVSPGFRYELGQTNSYGRITYLNADSIQRMIEHHLPAFGLATNYKPKGSHSVLIAGISQAHRPVIFKDIIPGSTLERAARNLKDARGYNAELSYNNFIWRRTTTTSSTDLNQRCSKNFNYTLSIYQTQYNNRMGNWVLFDSFNAVSFIQKTNIGNSRTRGFECILKFNVFDFKKNYKLSITNASALQRAIYTKATAVATVNNKDISGNRVEGVPALISRTNLDFQSKKLHLSVLYSYVSNQFSDALNTVAISANGAIGKVPAYGIWDIQGYYTIQSYGKIRFGLNNLLNKSYYTKRPTMYPGPGIWPSDGRGINIGLEFNF